MRNVLGRATTAEAADAALRRRMADEVPVGMMGHIDRVVELTDRLATQHGLDVPLARLMAQGHDLVRHVPPAELLARAEERGMAIDPVERDEPVILHGPVGAAELAERFDVRDPRVLFAIRWHTTGHPGYTPEAWAMFVADKVEPRKLERWEELRHVLAAAEASLERAALVYLDLRLQEATREGYLVHPVSVLARNHLLRSLSGAAAPPDDA